MEDAGLKNVEPLINRFGGMRPMARKVDVPVSTIQGWKKRDNIPADRVDDIIKAAKTHHISMHGYDVQSGANENTEPKQTLSTKTEDMVAPVAAPKKETPTDEAAQSAPRMTPPKFERKTIQLDGAQIKRDATRRSIMTTVGILAILGGVGYFLFADDAKKVISVAQDQQQLDTQITTLDDKYASFENTVTDGLNSLSQRVTDVAASVGVERNAQGEIILNNGMSVTERLTALESRLRDGEGNEIDLGQMLMNFKNLSQTFDGQTDTNAAMGDLQGVITILQGRMSQMDAALEQAKNENAQLAQSLENVSGRDIGAAGMLLALTQFRSSMNREEPFVDDLKILQGLVGENDPELTAAINRLAPHAQSGVLTTDGLSKELRSVTGDIIAAKLRGEDVSLKDKIFARIGQILSIEKDGKPVMASREQEIIASAQQSLDAGDVQGAMAQLKQLDGEAASVAQPFMEEMQGTLAAENTSQLLMQKFLEKLNQPGGMQSMIKDVPNQIRGMTGGTVVQDDASGIIILE
jgi:hypothetical protein